MISTLEIVTPADTQDLTILATVKTRLGISGSSEDALLEALIHEASGRIARFCRRSFALETVTQTIRLQGERPDFLMLERRPVTEITAVTVDDVALDAADWLLDADAGMLRRLSSDTAICWSGAIVEIDYEAGYALLETVPFDLESACIDLVVLAYFSAGERARDPNLMSRSIPDVAAETFQIGNRLGVEGGMPPDIAQRLAPFREYRLGT